MRLTRLMFVARAIRPSRQSPEEDRVIKICFIVNISFSTMKDTSFVHYRVPNFGRICVKAGGSDDFLPHAFLADIASPKAGHSIRWFLL